MNRQLLLLSGVEAEVDVVKLMSMCEGQMMMTKTMQLLISALPDKDDTCCCCCCCCSYQVAA